LFFLDAGPRDGLWLWQGWWPDVGHEANDTNVTTGSGKVRWHSERRCAMQTALEYTRAKYGSKRPKVRLVWAGHEPKDFVNLFPFWTLNPSVMDINQEHIETDDLEVVLSKLSKTNYSWEELQQRPLPDGVDPSRLERYLNESDFEKYLGLTKEAFNKEPQWKQLNIRKEKGLF